MPDLAQLVTDWGYPGIFLVVVLGNIGLPIPEETVLALAGYFVWMGRLQLLPVLIVGIVSAVAGDSLDYWLGRRYGRTATERYARWLLKPARVVLAEQFIRRYGSVAVCAARFIGGFRLLAGPLAGAVGLRFRSFVLGNALGAVVFVPYAVGIGYGLAYGFGPYIARLQNGVGDTAEIVLTGGIIVVVLLVAGRPCAKSVRRGLRYGIAAARRCARR